MLSLANTLLLRGGGGSVMIDLNILNQSSHD